MDIPGYEIKRAIGQGGMATAYLAVQKSLGRQVVLKVLDTTSGVSAEAVERFLNEGRLIASLRHPHIITIYDIGRAGDQVYLSMEHIDGGDLKQRMMQRIFTPHEALEVVEKIAAGLACAHDNGIVHRDVKPGNVLFRRDGTPILSDFGIAKRLAADGDLTATGMFLGSPNYMAPEQSEAGPIDGRADIYALGIILFEMLTGRRAFQADSVIDVIVMHKTAPVPRLPAGLEALQELLDLMLAKERTQRFRDARALLHYVAELRRRGVVRSPAELAAAADGSSGSAPAAPLATGTVTRLAPPPARRRLRLGLGVGLAAAAALWAVLLVLERDLGTPRAVPGAAAAAPLEAVPGGGPPGDARETARIVEALLWLGQRSLDELRLTAPPRDNAYYYFARLRQLDPDHPGAVRGLREIAARYALLAERELAADHPAEARAYIGIGRQLDPDNEALKALAALAEGRDGGFWNALASLFR